MEKPPAAESTPPSPRTPPPSTTYVRADAAAFKDLVQRLTAGPADASKHLHLAPPLPSPSPSSSPGPCSSAGHKGFGLKRLHEPRRGRRRRFTALRPMALSLPTSPRVGAPLNPLFSPSTSFADLRLLEQGGHAVDVELNEEEEEKAIKERRFYLHPSPRSRSRMVEPELLTLFPLTSRNSGQPQA